jgi:hypothetical protein
MVWHVHRDFNLLDRSSICTRADFKGVIGLHWPSLLWHVCRHLALDATAAYRQILAASFLGIPDRSDLLNHRPPGIALISRIQSGRPGGRISRWRT